MNPRHVNRRFCSPASRVRIGPCELCDHQRVCDSPADAVFRSRRPLGSILTTSRIPSERMSFTSPVIDYEPPPEPLGRRHSTPTPTRSVPAAVARHAAPPHRSTAAVPVDRRPPGHEPPPPRAAAVFADATLRRVLEVIDRRRPIAQLRPLLAPALIDTVVALTRAPAGRDGAAVLRRVRLRTAAFDDAEPHAPRRCSRPTPAVGGCGPSPRASKSELPRGPLAAGGPADRLKRRADQQAIATVLACRETPSASNGSSTPRPARSSR